MAAVAEVVGSTAAQWFLEQIFDEVKGALGKALKKQGEDCGVTTLTAIGDFLLSNRDHFDEKFKEYELNKLKIACLDLQAALIPLFKELEKKNDNGDNDRDPPELFDAMSALRAIENKDATSLGWSSGDRQSAFRVEIENANRSSKDAFVTINDDLGAKMKSLKILLFCKACIHKKDWPSQWNILLREFLQRHDVQKAWNKIKNPKTDHNMFMSWVKENLPKSLSQSDKVKKLQEKEQLFRFFMNVNRIFDKFGATPPEIIEITELPEADPGLFDALLAGSAKDVRTLLSNNRNVDGVDDTGRTPLFYAIEHKSPVDCVQYLIIAGADVHHQVFGLPPLFWTVVYENEDAASVVIQALRRTGIADNTLDYRNRTVLHFAAELGRVKMIKWFVEQKKFDINMTDGCYLTPLHSAVDCNNEEAVCVILGLGGDTTQSSLELFRLAAVRGYSNIAKILLECDWFDPSSITVDEWNALHVASSLNDVNLIKVLIERKGDIVGRTNEGETPMHMAAQKGHTEALKVLLEGYEELRNKTQKASEVVPGGQEVEEGKVNIQSAETSDRHAEEENIADVRINESASKGYDVLVTNSGATLLHYAARNNRIDTISFLLEKGFAADIEDCARETPLESSIAELNTEAVRIMLDHLGSNATEQLLRSAVYGNKEIMELLYQVGFSIDMSYSEGLTLLDMTAKIGNAEAIEWLLNKGAKMATDTDGYNALHHGSSNGRDNDTIIQLLCDNGFDVNAKTNNGQTPLHLAACRNNVKITTKLLELGAAIDAVDNDGNRAVHSAACTTAVVGNNTGTIKVLLQQRPDLVNMINNRKCTPLHYAAKFDNDKGILMLLKNGADLYAVDDQGQNALHYATFPVKCFMFRQPKIIELLIKKGIDKNSRTNNGSTPLHEAARQGNMKAVQELKAMDADFEAVDKNGNNAIHCAAYGSCDPETLKLLIGYGVDINAGNIVKSTPLHEAVRSGNTMAVKELLALGANPQAVNEECAKPIDYALDEEIINVLPQSVRPKTDDLNDDDGGHTGVPIQLLVIAVLLLLVLILASALFFT